MSLNKVFFATAVLIGLAQPAIAAQPVKVAVLKFGTVNWELDVAKRHRLDEKEGITLQIVPFASTQATKIALQANAADIIVTDWMWVSRQRAAGADLTLVPYSTALGAIMVPASSDIKSLKGLKGKKLGIAGGPLDKSWLLLRALSLRTGGPDLKNEVIPVYGAPPLLEQKLRQGELDAVLNFWHYSARLEADGFKRLISMDEVMRSLGGSGPMPMIGYTFRQSWAGKNKAALSGFLKAVAAARDIMARSDNEWELLRARTRAGSTKTLEKLRDRFRQGIPKRDNADLEKDAATMFQILAALGGKKLTGGGSSLAVGTFWRSAR